jgi:hypothetical protein
MDSSRKGQASRMGEAWRCKGGGGMRASIAQPGPGRGGIDDEWAVH